MDLLGSLDVEVKEGDAAGSEGRPKTRRVETAKDKEQQKQILDIMMMVIKLKLWTAQQARNVNSIVIRVWKVPVESPFVQLSKAATQAYEKAIVAAREREGPEKAKEKLGIPCVHIFNSWVKYLLQHPPPSAPPQLIQIIQQAMAIWQEKGWKWILGYIPYVRIAKMFGDEFKKVEVSVPMYASWLETKTWPSEPSAVTPIHVFAILKEMLDDSGKELAGVAPRGELEKKLQAYLEEAAAK